MRSTASATQSVVRHAITRDRYSEELPERLSAFYRASLEDPALSTLQDELALCDARLKELIARLQKAGDDGHSWAVVTQLARKIVTQGASRSNSETVWVKIRQLLQMLEAGVSASKTWTELLTTIEQRRRCAETENRRIVLMGQAIPIKKVAELVGQLCQAFQTHTREYAEESIADRILDETARDIERIVGTHHLRRTEGEFMDPESDADSPDSNDSMFT